MCPSYAFWILNWVLSGRQWLASNEVLCSNWSTRTQSRKPGSRQDAKLRWTVVCVFAVRESSRLEIGSTFLRDNNVILDNVKTSCEVTVLLIMTGVTGFGSKLVPFLKTHISVTRIVLHNGQHTLITKQIKKSEK